MKTDSIYYIHKDYQGNMESITSEQGQLLETISFDPWGRRRNINTWEYDLTLKPQYFDRGYTMHQYLDVFGLINMNGRMYDPWVGRMLSPDPYIVDATNSQNYNRYSYALNNPLKYVDPTGYKPDFYDYEDEYNKTRGSGYSALSAALDRQMESHGYNFDSDRRLGSYYYHHGNYYDPYGNVYTYSEVYTNFVEPNSSESYTRIEDDSNDGMSYWMIEGNGQSVVISAIGDLGLSILNTDGAIGFANPKASVHLGELVVGQSNGNGIDGEDLVVGFPGAYLSTVGHIKQNKWGWTDANGNYRSTKLLKRGANGKYVRGVNGLRNGYSIAGKAASAVKIAGNVMGAVGVGMSVYDMTQNGINVSNSMDAIMGATTFIPVVGWIVSGTYFTTSFITELSTGRSISEHTQGWVETW